MEEGLVLLNNEAYDTPVICLNPYCSGRRSRTTALSASKEKGALCLNPYCSGRRSRTSTTANNSNFVESLNPYCSGRRSRTFIINFIFNSLIFVLILIVVEEGLVLRNEDGKPKGKNVLILIVVEEGLVRTHQRRKCKCQW